MATKNICTVEQLSEMTNNTNAIVEENGKLRRTNMQNVVDTALQTAKNSGEFKGEKGDKGDTGAQGPAGATGATGATFTPSVSSAGNLSWSNDKGLENPATVNIKGPKGDTGATGPQGPAGPKGDKGDTGAKGYTPVRGTDYWTDVDIAEIKSYVDEAILGGAW